MSNVTPIRPAEHTERTQINWSPETQAFLDKYGPKPDDDQ